MIYVNLGNLWRIEDVYYHATCEKSNAHKNGRNQHNANILIGDSESSDESEIELKWMNSQRPKFSVSMTDSFVESILDLKEWLKSPWEEL